MMLALPTFFQQCMEGPNGEKRQRHQKWRKDKTKMS